MRFISLVALLLAACSPVLRAHPIEDLPERPAGFPEKTARLFTLEYVRCQGYLDALLDVAGQADTASRDAGAAATYLGALTTAAGGTTAALTSRYATDKDRYQSQIVNTAMIGSLVTVAFGIPTAVVGYKGRAYQPQASAARNAAAKMRDLLANASNDVIAIDTTDQAKAQGKLVALTAKLKRECSAAWQGQADVPQPVPRPYMTLELMRRLLQDAGEDNDLKAVISSFSTDPKLNSSRLGH